ncbi:MAG: phosphatase PAP2 family protein [Sphingomicrobium sp.]
MREKFENRSTWAIVGLALAIFVLAALLGGPGAAPDIHAIQSLGSGRANNPLLTAFAIALTSIGGAPGTVCILILALVLLAATGRWRQATALGTIVLSGRVAVELLKLAISRPRPHFAAYPVKVASLSFPSGHAANSMMTFLTLALLLSPAGKRTAWVSLAIILSLIIGATRPFLGVHWPTDVIGGWSFGIAWVVTMAHLARAYGYWPASREFRAI